MTTMQQRAKERQFDQAMQEAAETVAYGVVPNLAKALALYNNVQVMLGGEFSDMQDRYTASVAPFAEDMPGILAAGQNFLDKVAAADVKAIADEDFGAVYKNGIFGTYEPEE